MPYKELYDYDGCAEFVADYLTYEPLKVPNELVSGIDPFPVFQIIQSRVNCGQVSEYSESFMTKR